MLEADWRKMLFPEATDAQFADGYAQAVTFGLLVARARKIRLTGGLDQVAKELASTNSLIGTALRIVTEDVENETTLKTSLATLTRVLDVVDWDDDQQGERRRVALFLRGLPRSLRQRLRKQTGSYYTPPEVVAAMVRLVDEALRSSAASAFPAAWPRSEVTVADPAIGTGTFMLGVLRRIAETIAADEGEGAVPGAIHAAMNRLIAFEMQLGPFAVAQLRILAEIVALTGDERRCPANVRHRHAGQSRRSRKSGFRTCSRRLPTRARQANQIKREEPITVVIGNPPYKEKAKGRGGWVEAGDGTTASPDPRRLDAAAEWGVGAHAKHLRNLYVYFWRWATYKVFDHDPDADTGIVCFITVAGFLNGPGFQKMRDYLRRDARRNLGDRLLARGPSAGRADAHLPGRAAAGVHRAGGTRQAGRREARDGPLPDAARGASRGEIRRFG